MTREAKDSWCSCFTLLDPSMLVNAILHFSFAHYLVSRHMHHPHYFTRARTTTSDGEHEGGVSRVDRHVQAFADDVIQLALAERTWRARFGCMGA